MLSRLTHLKVGDEFKETERDQTFRALEPIPRTLAFALQENESHWRVLRIACSGLYLSRITWLLHVKEPQ